MAILLGFFCMTYGAQRLTHAAVMAGSLTAGVNPMYSTDCPTCGSRIRMALSERTHVCLLGPAGI